MEMCRVIYDTEFDKVLVSVFLDKNKITIRLICEEENLIIFKSLETNLNTIIALQTVPEVLVAFLSNLKINLAIEEAKRLKGERPVIPGFLKHEINKP